METIAISKFKATCLRLLEKVKNTGDSILVTKKDVPIALVSPPPRQPKKKSSFGSMKGSVIFHDDIIGSLPENDWEVLKASHEGKKSGNFI